MINNIERLFFQSFSPTEIEECNGWIFGSSDAETRRLNSVIPINKPDRPLSEMISSANLFYHNRNKPTIFKITKDSLPSVLDIELDLLGYKKEGITKVNKLNWNKYLSRKYENTILYDDIKSNEFNLWFAKNNTYQEIYQKAYNLGKIAYAIKYLNNRTVGYGMTIVIGNNAFIYNISILPEFRKNGYSYDIMNCLINCCKNFEATNIYLQVVKDNIPAKTLYKNLGFENIYEYWYRTKSI